jgi:hypothetical protein
LLGTASNTCYSSSGCGQLTVQIAVATTRIAEFSANYDVSAEVVSAGVGFTIGTQYQIQTQSSYTENNVPYNKSIYIQAYEVIDITGFNIYEKGWFSDTLRGSGSAWKPVPNTIQTASWKNY